MPRTASPARPLWFRGSAGRLLVALGVAVVSAFAGAVTAGAPAAAHTGLQASSPADGATVATPPELVRLRFNAAPAASPLDVAVTLEGVVVASGPARTEGSTVVLPVTPAGPGTYTVAYRVVSADGHPVQGAVRFTVTGDASPAATPTPSGGTAAAASANPTPAATPTGPVPPPQDTSRWPHFVIALVILILIGIGIVLLTGPKRPKRERF